MEPSSPLRVSLQRRRRDNAEDVHQLPSEALFRSRRVERRRAAQPGVSVNQQYLEVKERVRAFVAMETESHSMTSCFWHNFSTAPDHTPNMESVIFRGSGNCERAFVDMFLADHAELRAMEDNFPSSRFHCRHCFFNVVCGKNCLKGRLYGRNVRSGNVCYKCYVHHSLRRENEACLT